MNETQTELTQEYVSLLKEYLEKGGESALQRAYEIAREAMTEGFGVLDIAEIHHEALSRLLRLAITPDECQRLTKAAETFLVETLSPFEMTHRTYRDATTALRRLNERLEDEARRIAHSLHEEAGQLLASVYLALDEIARELPPADRMKFDGVKALLDQITEQIRHLSHELRPTILDDLGLVPALKFLAEGVSARTGITVAVEGHLKERLPGAIETAVYRIAKEALNNLGRHAQATRANVKVRKEQRRVRCSIRDNGTGFDVDAAMKGNGGGLGLLGIRERLDALGGTLQITSIAGRGTDLVITIPTEE